MSTLTVTAKVRIFPTEDDKTILRETMEAYCKACNFVSKYIFTTHQLNVNALSKRLYWPLRNQFMLKSQMAQSVIKTVVAKYKTILANEHEWIEAHFNIPQLELVWNRDYSLTQSLFSLNTLSGRIKLAYNNKGMEQYFDASTYKFGTSKLVVQNGKFFLHIPVTFKIEDVQLFQIANVVGVDRGINFLAATYDSNGNAFFIKGRHIKQKRAKYKKTRQQLQKRKTKSARRKLKQYGSRENRWMQDVNHCASKALVTSNPEYTLFVLEDLTGIRNVTERVRIKDRYVSVSWAYADFENKLRYKALRNKCLVINVNPAYTSQTCPKCGDVHKSNRNKKIHFFKCKNCGYQSNDDRIAAMNLFNQGINHLLMVA